MEETSYALAFETEVIILAELGSGSYRVKTFKVEASNEGLKLHLDLLQEKRDQAQITMSAYQARVARYFNRKVKPQSFKVGDLVLRKVTLATQGSYRKEASSELGRSLQGDQLSETQSVLFERYGREGPTKAMKCGTFEKILLLIM